MALGTPGVGRGGMTDAPTSPSPPDADALWAALQRREPRGDALYGVEAQRVYCRFGCPSRLPLRRNARFFADRAAAEAAGYRPCRRCDPDGARAALHAEVVRTACALIETGEDAPSLATLAARAGYARHHFLRLFRDNTGLTPAAYAAAVRARRLAAALAAGQRVADAVAGAGFGSESRVYGNGAAALGMTPGAARRGGAGEVIRTAFAPSVLGPMLVGATAKGVCSVAFGADEASLLAELRARFPGATLVPADAALEEVVRRVAAHLAEPRAALALPLDLRGTAFQRRVWEALRAIPAGETRSYGVLAASLGAPRGARAVARACAGNPVAVAVPCHRVVGGKGALTGYRWGLERKRALLAAEAAATDGRTASAGPEEPVRAARRGG